MEEIRMSRFTPKQLGIIVLTVLTALIHLFWELAVWVMAFWRHFYFECVRLFGAAGRFVFYSAVGRATAVDPLGVYGVYGRYHHPLLCLQLAKHLGCDWPGRQSH